MCLSRVSLLVLKVIHHHHHPQRADLDPPQSREAMHRAPAGAATRKIIEPRLKPIFTGPQLNC